MRSPRYPPFTPDTSFAYACASHQEALNTLLVAVKNGEGFIKITGEVGTGKTLLCRKFLSSLDENWVSLYIPNPALDPQTLLDLGVIHKLKDGLKVLGSGDLKRKINVKAHVFSKSALDKIQAAGGTAEVLVKQPAKTE